MSLAKSTGAYVHGARPQQNSEQFGVRKGAFAFHEQLFAGAVFFGQAQDLQLWGYSMTVRMFGAGKVVANGAFAERNVGNKRRLRRAKQKALHNHARLTRVMIP
jgi:hypothetical protein